MRTYLKDSLEVPVLKACWRHSLACAIIAEHLSRAALIDKDAAYTAGMLHDIGRLALAVCHRRKYADFLHAADAEPCDVLVRERELFGVDHCQAGSALIASWNLPDRFKQIAAHHHDVEGGETLALLSLIHLARALAEHLGYDVVRSLNPPTYEQLRAQLPPATLPSDPADLAAHRFGNGSHGACLAGKKKKPQSMLRLRPELGMSKCSTDYLLPFLS